MNIAKETQTLNESKGGILLVPESFIPENEGQVRAVAFLMAMTAMTHERREWGHFIPVHSLIWRKVVGRNYRATLNTLLAANVITENCRYAAGRFSKSYRLTDRYRKPQFQKVATKRSKGQKNRIRIDAQDWTGQAMAANFELFSLPTNLKCRGWSLYSTQMIYSQEYYAIRCEYGRFHSSFTSISRECRKTLAESGNATVEVDISNSQPLILGILASRERQTNNPPQTPTTHPIPYVVQFRATDDWGKFIELCETGQLYEFLLEQAVNEGLTLFDAKSHKYRRPKDRERPVCRAVIKKLFVLAMFMKPRKAEQLAIWPIIEREFPSVARFMQQAKKRGYQQLAHQCQRLESRMMVGPDGVAGSLAQQGIPFITVHDSIIAAADNRDLITGEINRVYKGFGVVPALSVSQFRANVHEDLD